MKLACPSVLLTSVREAAASPEAEKRQVFIVDGKELDLMTPREMSRISLLFGETEARRGVELQHLQQLRRPPFPADWLEAAAFV